MPEDKEAPVYTAERILLKRVRKVRIEFKRIPQKTNDKVVDDRVNVLFFDR